MPLSVVGSNPGEQHVKKAKRSTCNHREVEGQRIPRGKRNPLAEKSNQLGTKATSDNGITRASSLTKKGSSTSKNGKGVHDTVKRQAVRGARYRPSLIRRVNPVNLEEAEEAFFASGCTAQPSFQYHQPLAKELEKLTVIHKEYFGLAEGILRKAKNRYGSEQGYMSATYGTETLGAADFKEEVMTYVRSLGIWQKVDVRLTSQVLSIACVSKASPKSPYVISLQDSKVLAGMARPICDHEAGTHLLRMANDTGQAWFHRRQSWNLRNHHETEEGLATINSLLSLPHSLLLWSPALRYYAACRATELGFVELFEELKEFVDDPIKRFRLCARVKRGLHNPALPGAVNIDQAYFCGSVDILRHFREIDLTLLYAGHLAIQDLEKIKNLVRPEMCRLPPFLLTPGKISEYYAFFERVAAENEIPAAKVPLFSVSMRPSLSASSCLLKRRGSKTLKGLTNKKEMEQADSGQVMELSGACGD